MATGCRCATGLGHREHLSALASGFGAGLSESSAPPISGQAIISTAQAVLFLSYILISTEPTSASQLGWATKVYSLVPQNPNLPGHLHFQFPQIGGWSTLLGARGWLRLWSVWVVPHHSEAPGKFPKVPGRGRGKRVFPAPTQEKPGESFLNAS